MKLIKCPSCGSSVDPSSKFCEYCGSHFEKKENETSSRSNNEIKNKIKQTMSDEALNSIISDNTSNFPTIILSVFLIIWCIGALSISISVASSGMFTLFSIFPIFVGGAGALAMIYAIKTSKASNTKQVTALCEQKKYDKAYSLLKAKLNTSKNIFTKSSVLKKLILIGYYKLNKTDEVKDYISVLETIDYDKNPAIIKIAKELGVSYDIEEEKEQY